MGEFEEKEENRLRRKRMMKDKEKRFERLNKKLKPFRTVDPYHRSSPTNLARFYEKLIEENE